MGRVGPRPVRLLPAGAIAFAADANYRSWMRIRRSLSFAVRVLVNELLVEGAAAGGGPNGDGSRESVGAPSSSCPPLIPDRPSSHRRLRRPVLCHLATMMIKRNSATGQAIRRSHGEVRYSLLPQSAALERNPWDLQELLPDDTEEEEMPKWKKVGS
uniref:Uncharacterized protein n=1 Tax=Plectus sambesii TaxID=2011161 RepID=A0A914UY25_9BILA